MTGETRRAIRILFLGQCIAAGYGVEEPGSYPRIIQQMLAAQFPELNFKIKFRALLHPTGLRALLETSLLHEPDLIFISLPAIFASIPFRVNSLYLAAPDIMRVARSFVEKIESRIRRDSGLAKIFGKRSALMPTVVCPAIDSDEYERLIEDALTFCQQSSTCRMILMGPGGFNEDAGSGELDSPEVFSTISQMVVKVGERLKVPVVNVNDCMTDLGGKAFITGTHKWNQHGHEVMAREIRTIIACEVKAMSVTQR